MKKTVKYLGNLKVTTYTRVLDRGSKRHGYPRVVAKVTEVQLVK